MSVGWDPSLETGHTTIDSQHRELLAIVDELETAAADAPDSRAVVLDVLHRIMDYALSHFAMEEELMAQVGYPSSAVEEMMQQHREFTSGARMRVLEFRRGELVSVLPLQAFLTGWLAVHVVDLDRRLADFIREQASALAEPNEGE